MKPDGKTDCLKKDFQVGTINHISDLFWDSSGKRILTVFCLFLKTDIVRNFTEPNFKLAYLIT